MSIRPALPMTCVICGSLMKSMFKAFVNNGLRFHGRCPASSRHNVYFLVEGPLEEPRKRLPPLSDQQRAAAKALDIKLRRAEERDRICPLPDPPGWSFRETGWQETPCSACGGRLQGAIDTRDLRRYGLSMCTRCGHESEVEIGPH